MVNIMKKVYVVYCWGVGGDDFLIKLIYEGQVGISFMRV